MTTAAQNIHVLFRKSPLCRSHFFEWLKTAISSTACGTATLKSLLSQAFFVPDVHPRPRKHLSRCTLDCGFKTSESPALRGFVGERCPIRGTSLYLVLKSNGLRHSKNLPVKFGFSSKTVPVNIAEKLPSQRCFKPLFIAFFNFSHKRPTFAFTGKSGYTPGFRRKIAHSGSHAETGGIPSANAARLCAASEIATERTAGESGCTPVACVRFSPASRPRRAARSNECAIDYVVSMICYASATSLSVLSTHCYPDNSSGYRFADDLCHAVFGLRL